MARRKPLEAISLCEYIFERKQLVGGAAAPEYISFVNEVLPVFLVDLPLIKNTSSS